MPNRLKINYDHIPAKVTIHSKGVLVKKWNEKKPIDLVHKVIDGMEVSGFEKVKLKQSITTVMEVFEPKNISIVEKDE